MKTSTWSPAIAVEDPDTHAMRTIATVREARRMLNRNWPTPEGSQYRQAEAACEQALHGEAEAGDARRAFIAAAIEAHLRIG